jgi:hypothetical protein
VSGSNLWDEFDLEEVYNFLKDHYSSSRLSQQGINQPEEVIKNGLSQYILVVIIIEKSARRNLLCYSYVFVTVFLLQIDDFFCLLQIDSSDLEPVQGPAGRVKPWDRKFPVRKVSSVCSLSILGAR